MLFTGALGAGSACGVARDFSSPVEAGAGGAPNAEAGPGRADGDAAAKEDADASAGGSGGAVATDATSSDVAVDSSPIDAAPEPTSSDGPKSADAAADSSGGSADVDASRPPGTLL